MSERRSSTDSASTIVGSELEISKSSISTNTHQLISANTIEEEDKSSSRLKQLAHDVKERVKKALEPPSFQQSPDDKELPYTIRPHRGGGL